MARAIDADELKKYAFRMDDIGGTLVVEVDDIDDAPTIDPVKYGKWLKLDGDWKNSETGEPIEVHQCSVCGMYYMHAPYNYCPNCGARMDGE